MAHHPNHVKIMESMLATMDLAENRLQIPPSSFTSMKCQFTAFDKTAMSLSIAFPYDPLFCNPIGAMQGGMLVTAFDNAFGPLSYLVAQRPTVTLHIHTDFIRPFTNPEGIAHAHVKCTAKTQTMLFMSGELKDHKDRLLASASTQLLILSEAQLNRY